MATDLPPDEVARLGRELAEVTWDDTVGPASLPALRMQLSAGAKRLAAHELAVSCRLCVTAAARAIEDAAWRRWEQLQDEERRA